jgi:TRAP-type C4-dicarboxylate transport system permease small subunit
MHWLDRSSKGLARAMYRIAGTAIVCMMLLTCVDVLLRLCVTIYHATEWDFLIPLKPIPGTYELVCFMGSVAVAFAMAHTSVEKGHVAVSFIVAFFPKRVQAVIETVTTCFGLTFFILLTWRSILYAGDLIEMNEVSLTLQLPFYPFVYGIAFSAFSLCLVLLSNLLKNLREVFAK